MISLALSTHFLVGVPAKAIELIVSEAEDIVAILDRNCPHLAIAGSDEAGQPLSEDLNINLVHKTQPPLTL
jgi:hypothetical protein